MVEHDVTLRVADVKDAPALADLHIRGWQWAYQGQMPDTYLDGLSASLEQRMVWWQSVLSAAQSEGRTWVAEVGVRLVGFAGTGPNPDADAAGRAAELYAIYLDQASVGRGIGRILHAQALSDLRQRGYETAGLWVLATNQRARRFYEAAGWRLEQGKNRIERLPDGYELHEVRYRIVLDPSES
jgi:ribosomal protein S18 acetylase RimI-like enzyme